MKTRLFVGLLACFSFASIGLAAKHHTTQPADVSSVVGDSGRWAAIKWSPDDLALFGGIPAYSGADKDLVLLRYSFYTSEYNADRITPLWVAHVDHAAALQNEKTRTAGHDPKWARPPAFFPDKNVIDFAKARHLPYAVQESYTNANPSELPGSSGSPTDITRGHNASNDEMKLEGDDEEGVQSQHESFSLANVSPQTQHHNAPMWAALENDCLVWASKLGSVAVITGPVYSPQPIDPVTGRTNPIPVSKIVYTNGKAGPQIPIPTHFFKVIIGRMDGKLAAIGFLVPHLSTLAKDGYKQYAMPISAIERATGLTFMPEAAIAADKNVVDQRWLPLLGK